MTINLKLYTQSTISIEEKPEYFLINSLWWGKNSLLIKKQCPYNIQNIFANSISNTLSLIVLNIIMGF